jgi:hypothetical protein
MSPKDTTTPPMDKPSATQFLNFGQERAETAMNLQKELMQAYEQASRAWLERVQTELSLWTDLASKLTATRSLPDAIEAYTKTVSRQIQMTAEDGKRLLDNAQQVTDKITKALGNDWPRQGRPRH